MSPSSILRRISARDCTDYLAVDFDAGSLITCTFHGALRSLVRYLVVGQLVWTFVAWGKWPMALHAVSVTSKIVL